jgi:hypothetical protein
VVAKHYFFWVGVWFVVFVVWGLVWVLVGFVMGALVCCVLMELVGF